MVDEWMQRVLDKLDAIERRLSRLEASQQPQTVSIQDIADDLGVSYEWARSRPWVQPNFGKPDIPGRPKRWKHQTWAGWRDRIDEHQGRWESMTPAKRRQLIAST